MPPGSGAQEFMQDTHTWQWPFLMTNERQMRGSGETIPAGESNKPLGVVSKALSRSPLPWLETGGGQAS